MEELRCGRNLQVCIPALYKISEFALKVCCLNACSLHKHIEDVRNDFNYCNSDIVIFTETRFSPLDHDEMTKSMFFGYFVTIITLLVMVTRDLTALPRFIVKSHLLTVIPTVKI